MTYFQEGLSSLINWRIDEAMQRFVEGDQARNILPIVVIAGSRSAHMHLCRTNARVARLFVLGVPLLDDESLLGTAMDFLARVAAGTGRKVPETAEPVSSCSY